MRRSVRTVLAAASSQPADTLASGAPVRTEHWQKALANSTQKLQVQVWAEVDFEPPELNGSWALQRAWTMHEQTPGQSQQRSPHESFRFRGAASSCTFNCPPVQHKARHSALERQQTTGKNTHGDTEPPHSTTGLWPPRKGRRTRDLDSVCGTKNSSVVDKAEHTLTSGPTEAMVPGR